MPQASASECVCGGLIGGRDDIGAGGGDRSHQRHQHPHPGAGVGQGLVGQHDQQHAARAEGQAGNAQRLEALQPHGEGHQVGETRHQGEHQGDDPGGKLARGKRRRQNRQHHREQRRGGGIAGGAPGSAAAACRRRRPRSAAPGLRRARSRRCRRRPGTSHARPQACWPRRSRHTRCRRGAAAASARQAPARAGARHRPCHHPARRLAWCVLSWRRCRHRRHRSGVAWALANRRGRSTSSMRVDAVS